MSSWPLWVQWVLLVLVGGTFLGTSWRLTLSRARTEGVAPATWGRRARMVFGAFRIGDWAVVALLVLFLGELVSRSVTGT